MNPFRAFGALRAYGTCPGLGNLALALALFASLAGAAAAEVRVLAFGDSLTAGYGLPPDQGFVPQLEAWLHAHGAPDATVINAGVSGDTSAGGLARIGWTLEQPVDAVLVELGANDMLRGLPVDAMRRNLDGILAETGRRGLPTLLAGIPAPPNFDADYRKAFKAAFREVAREHDAIYVSSFFGGMAEGRSMRQIMGLFQPDGLHPTAQGVAAIVEGIGPPVLELVEEGAPAVIRAFAALALPEPVRFELMLVQQGLPLPRPVPPENLHLTLVFLGEVPERRLEDVDTAFRQLRAAPFEVALTGLGVFGGARPRLVYAGAAESPGLRHLQAKTETAARGAGIELPARRFVPHVTLARLPVRFADRVRLEQAVAARGGYAGPRFTVEEFRLYRSHLGAAGPLYEELARYPLE